MTTKYDIGEVVVIPAKVRGAKIDHKGTIYYELVKVANNDLSGISGVSEENIIGSLEEYYNPTTELHHVHN